MLAALAACNGSDQPDYVPRDPCAALAIIASPATAVERDGIVDALALWRDHGVAAFDRLFDAPLDPSFDPSFDPSGDPSGDPSFDPSGDPSGDPSPQLSPDAARDAIEVRFDDAGSVFHGVYDPDMDRVIINRGITDRATIAIVLAHELGHVFGLSHIASSARVSLMNPGNLRTPPTDADQRALEERWGICK